MANDRGSDEFEEIRILGLETPEDVIQKSEDDDSSEENKEE